MGDVYRVNFNQKGDMTLSDYQRQFEAIVAANMQPNEQDKALSDLMTRMEQKYSIPGLEDKKWESEHRAVIELYRRISDKRSI